MNRNLDQSFTEDNPAHQSKTQIPPQSVPPIRKLPQASYAYPSEGRQNENHNYRKLTKLITWITKLSNSMQLWTMLCRVTQDGGIMVDSSDKWSTGEGNGKPLQYSCLENPMNSIKRQKDRTGKPGMLHSMELQKVRHDWVTELTDWSCFHMNCEIFLF